MKWKLYDDEFQDWGIVVTQPRFKQHVDKVATPTELGHIMIDENTLITDVNGQVKVADNIAKVKSSNIVFNVGAKISSGRIEEAFYLSTYNAKIKKLNISIVNTSAMDIVFNLQKTTDFVTYDNVFDNPMTISANSHTGEFIVNGNISILNGENLFLNIVSSDDLAQNMVVNITVEKQ